MIHPWYDVTPGDRLPAEFAAVIEIPMGSSVKYELDKRTGLLRIQRKDAVAQRRNLTRRNPVSRKKPVL